MSAMYGSCSSVFILCKLMTLTMAFEDLTITLSDNDCDTQYDLEEFNSIYFEYHGSTILTSNPCHVEFVKRSNKRAFCISAKEVSIGCRTELEYHEYFVKNYIEPEKKVTCNDTNVDVWCPSQYQDNIFVVIRKPGTTSTDIIRLSIYLKDVPETNYGASPALWLIMIIPASVLIMYIVIAVKKVKARRRAAAQRPQVIYQTTTGSSGILSGYSCPQPAIQSDHPVQQTEAPQVQGNYTVHPMQTAYPVAQPQSATNAGLDPQQYPPVPSMNPVAVPPPSYDSLVEK